MKTLKIIAVILLATVVPVIPVAAQNIITGDVERTTQTTAEYYEDVRRTYPVSLDDDRRQQIISRCSAAQESIAKIHERLERRSEPITSVYRLIGVQFEALGKRLEANSKDSTSVKHLDTLYAKERTAVETQLTSYREAISHARDIDCREDPETFLSLLENARAKNRELTTALVAINNLLRYDMTNTFTAVRAAIGSSE